jgi:hypothetical protein
MIKNCVTDFDSTNYVDAEVGNLVADTNVKITGSMSINKKSGKSKNFLSVTMAKKNNLVGATIFEDSPMYGILEKFDGGKIDGSIYGTVYINGKYVNLNVANISYFVDDDVDPKEFNMSESEVYVELKSFAEEIEDLYIRNVVLDIYNNERIMKKFLMAPASEFSAYSYLGGLAKMTLDTCFVSMSMLMNRDLADLLGVNMDLVLASALLCNIGRAYMYDIDKDGKFYKNEYGIIDSDTSLTRDVVKNAMRNVGSIVDDEGNVKYKPHTSDVVKELIHMLDTSKCLIGFQSSMVPRTKNASIFSSIVNIVNTVGTFNKLENSNVANDKLVKAFEGGKFYFIPNL